MDQELSVIEALRKAFSRHETLEQDLDLLVAMNRSAFAEDRHVMARLKTIEDFAREFFGVVAEAWDCTYEDAVDECGKLHVSERYMAQGRDTVAALPYKDYLLSAHWQGIRQYALLRADYRCQLCNSSGPLDVHHRTYEGKGAEDYRDVIALCRDCHAKFHGKENRKL